MRPFDPRLLREVPSTRRPVAVLGALGVLSGIATVATTFALSALVVAVVNQGELRTPAIWLGALFLVRAGLAAAGERAAAACGVQVTAHLRTALLRRWSYLPADERPPRDTAVTLATSGIASIEPYAARYLPTLVTAAVVPALAILTLFVVDWPSAVIVVLTVPLLPVFAALIGHATQDSTERRWGALASLAGHFLDVVRGLPTLVSYGRATRQVETVREVSERHRRATMKTLRLAFLSSAALELLATISVAIVAVTVGLRLSNGSMALGTGLVAILLAPEAYWPIRRVGSEFHSAADGSVALDAVLDQLDGAAEPATCAKGPIEADAVGYRYPGTPEPVFSGIDLTIPRGLTLISGTSGSGKSTLLEVLAGLRIPTEGRLDAGIVHLMTQRPFLTAGSVRENLTLGGPINDTTLWTALRQVDLEDVLRQVDGLDTVIGDDGFGLSAGQRQRLALARAWLAVTTGRLDALLLDEPTAHLDTDQTRSAVLLIEELARRHPVVVVTHQPELFTASGQRIVLGESDAEPIEPDQRADLLEVAP